MQSIHPFSSSKSPDYYLVKWPQKLETIPDNDEYETFASRKANLYSNTYVPPTDDQMSDISNMTVNEKSYDFINKE